MKLFNISLVSHLTVLSLPLLFLFTSCIDENLNIDPNRPSSVQTTSLIVTAQKQLVDNVRVNQHLFEALHCLHNR